MATSIRITQDDRAAIAQAKAILEKEHKGIKFSMMAVLRFVLCFFLDAKKASPTKK